MMHHTKFRQVSVLKCGETLSPYHEIKDGSFLDFKYTMTKLDQ